MSNLRQKKILLAITGSIAAYKSVELIRLLRSEGAEVKVVLTKDACEFVTELTLQAISSQPVHKELLDPVTEASMSHITLAKWADLLIVAPATANIMAKFAAGIADDLLTTLYLACSAPIVIVPAMNQQMWQHPATQDNKEKLLTRDHLFWGPGFGEQACGDVGPGRMLEPAEIMNLMDGFFSPKKLQGMKIILTAGPTREPIDPIRYISNNSSGKMGYALAKVVSNLGADVLLISGPTKLAPPLNVKTLFVETAEEMHAAVMSNISDCDLFVSSAAVGDYRCSYVYPQKIKKSNLPIINFEKNKDILAEVGLLENPPFLVGFAAETENLIANAKEKLLRKNLDMIIANQISPDNKVFDSDFNQITVLTHQEQIEFPFNTKQQLAEDIISLIIKTYEKKMLDNPNKKRCLTKSQGCFTPESSQM